MQGRDDPSTVQRAALSLHALAPTDREWVMQSLPANQRDVLRPLLAELHALGIPAEASLLEPLLRHGAPAPVADASASADPLARLDAAGFASIAGILSGEPARVTGALLASRSAGFRERLLTALPREPDDLATATPWTAQAHALQAAATEELGAVLRERRQSERALGRWRKLRDRLLSLRRPR